jgi:hypothetical protein
LSNDKQVKKCFTFILFLSQYVNELSIEGQRSLVELELVTL